MKRLCSILLTAMASGVAAEVSWQREVVPVLRANCVSCHKPGRTKGGLDLTSHAAVLKGGTEGVIVKPGYPRASKLIECVCGEEPEMPKEGETLSAAEVEVLNALDQ